MTFIPPLMLICFSQLGFTTSYLPKAQRLAIRIHEEPWPPFLWTKWFLRFLERYFKSRFRTMNDEYIWCWEGK
ncbi:hypothetical protein ACB092_11G153200 [Castanea dentata]